MQKSVVFFIFKFMMIAVNISLAKKLEWIARVGVFGTFLGHGIVACSINTKWIPLLTCVGFIKAQAIIMMPYIGITDVIVAFLILCYPLRSVLIWTALWAFMAAMSRPLSGEPMVEFVERSANWCLPLLLLVLMKNQEEK